MKYKMQRNPSANYTYSTYFYLFSKRLSKAENILLSQTYEYVSILPGNYTFFFMFKSKCNNKNLIY